MLCSSTIRKANASFPAKHSSFDELIFAEICWIYSNSFVNYFCDCFCILASAQTGHLLSEFGNDVDKAVLISSKFYSVTNSPCLSVHYFMSSYGVRLVATLSTTTGEQLYTVTGTNDAYVLKIPLADFAGDPLRITLTAYRYFNLDVSDEVIIDSIVMDSNCGTAAGLKTAKQFFSVDVMVAYFKHACLVFKNMIN